MSSYVEEILEIQDQLNRAEMGFITKPDTAKMLLSLSGALLELEKRLLKLEDTEKDLLGCAYAYGYEQGRGSSVK
jgi:hypothetical protein